MKIQYNRRLMNKENNHKGKPWVNTVKSIGVIGSIKLVTGAAGTLLVAHGKLREHHMQQELGSNSIAPVDPVLTPRQEIKLGFGVAGSGYVMIGVYGLNKLRQKFSARSAQR